MWNCNCPCHCPNSNEAKRYPRSLRGASSNPNDMVFTQSRYSNNDDDDNEGPENPSHVLKSESDKREYRSLTLPNKLKVLLISDPETDKSAAALSVLVGSMLDPENIPGLAHFCEHMLFLGTEKYPEENSFQKFLNVNGGDYNAFTQRDLTDFYFDVSTSSEALQGALDRFAQFFQVPLFTESSAEREINAVNSEHEKNIPDDAERRAQVETSLTKMGHPYRKFECGNKLTLFIRPKEQGINMQEELRRFYRENYSANLMTLAVLAKESLDNLENMVTPIFSRIQNQNLPIPSWPGSPYGPEELATRIDLVPVMDILNLGLIFPMPDYTPLYRSGSISYIGFLIGHEGPGGLLSYLRKKHWTTNPVSVQYDRPGKGFAVLTIDIDLTPLGMQKWEEVVLAVFQYVALLKKEGPVEAIWNEIRIIGENNFRYLEKDLPINYVQNLVTLMHNFPIRDVIACKYLISDYRPQLITKILDLINPQNLRIVRSTKMNQAIADQTEPWYGAQFKYSKIAPSLLSKWEKCGLNNELKLPPRNLFLPTNFGLKPRDIRSCGNTPRIIEDTELSRVWFLQDQEFKLPLASVMLAIVSPLPRQSLKYYNLASLMVRVVQNSISEYVADAESAGLVYDLEASLTGLSVTVSGYDEKIRLLFHHVLKNLVHFQKAGDQYHDIKEEYVRDLENWKEEEPFVHAIDYTNELMRDCCWGTPALLKSMKKDKVYSAADLVNFAKKFFSRVKLTWFFHGNLTECEALQMYQSGIKHFETVGSNAASPAEVVGSREAILPTGTTHIFRAEHHTHWNSCALVVLQVGVAGIHDTILLDLIETIVSEPAYDILRTKEQLGYVVLTDVRKSRGTLALRFIVQGEREPDFLDKRIETFLQSVSETFEMLTDEEFLETLKAVSVLKAEKPKTLYGRSSMIFEEITRNTYNFDRQCLELEELQTATREEVQDLFKAWISPSSPKRKKLVVRIASVVEDSDNIRHHQQRSETTSGVTTPKPRRTSANQPADLKSPPRSDENRFSHSTPISKVDPAALKSFPTKASSINKSKDDDDDDGDKQKPSPSNRNSMQEERRSSIRSSMSKPVNDQTSEDLKRSAKSVTLSEVVHAISPLEAYNRMFGSGGSSEEPGTKSKPDQPPAQKEPARAQSVTKTDPPTAAPTVFDLLPDDDVDPRFQRKLGDEYMVMDDYHDEGSSKEGTAPEYSYDQPYHIETLRTPPPPPLHDQPAYDETRARFGRTLHDEYLKRPSKQDTEEDKHPPLIDDDDDAANLPDDDQSSVHTWDNEDDRASVLSDELDVSASERPSISVIGGAQPTMNVDTGDRVGQGGQNGSGKNGAHSDKKQKNNRFKVGGSTSPRRRRLHKKPSNSGTSHQRAHQNPTSNNVEPNVVTENVPNNPPRPKKSSLKKPPSERRKSPNSRRNKPGSNPLIRSHSRASRKKKSDGSEADDERDDHQNVGKSVPGPSSKSMSKDTGTDPGTNKVFEALAVKSTASSVAPSKTAVSRRADVEADVDRILDDAVAQTEGDEFGGQKIPPLAPLFPQPSEIETQPKIDKVQSKVKDQDGKMGLDRSKSVIKPPNKSDRRVSIQNSVLAAEAARNREIYGLGGQNTSTSTGNADVDDDEDGRPHTVSVDHTNVPPNLLDFSYVIFNDMDEINSVRSAHYRPSKDEEPDHKPHAEAGGVHGGNKVSAEIVVRKSFGSKEGSKEGSAFKKVGSVAGSDREKPPPPITPAPPPPTTPAPPPTPTTKPPPPPLPDLSEDERVASEPKTYTGGAFRKVDGSVAGNNRAKPPPPPLPDLSEDERVASEPNSPPETYTGGAFRKVDGSVAGNNRAKPPPPPLPDLSEDEWVASEPLTSATLETEPGSARTILITDIAAWKATLEYYPHPAPFKQYSDFKSCNSKGPDDNNDDNCEDGGNNGGRRFEPSSTGNNNGYPGCPGPCPSPWSGGCPNVPSSNCNHHHHQVGYACFEVDGQSTGPQITVYPTYNNCQHQHGHGCPPQ